MPDLNNGILGIDISKVKFDVALMVAGKIKKTHMIDDFFEKIVFKAGYLCQNWVFLQRS